jgi:light-regulated signal transduction histidine kinase (bacteriophytochrome)
MRDPAGTITGIVVHGVDVTDQVLSRREVERLNAELEERVRERTLQFESINQEMEGFTYSVSHDLRAPLRAIVSSSNILLRDFGDQLDSNAKRELLRQAAAANKLAVLIDELLKLSRLTRQEMRRQIVSFSEVAKDVTSELIAHGSDNNCEFRIAEDITAVADPATLRLLLVNLLGNSCKFSTQGGLVEVGQTLSEGATVLWVRDEGVGFDMRYVDKIFLPFERLVLDSEYSGSGIGLANAKRIVERHGGRIWAKSAPGQGTTFYFTLNG